jgi:hypothetical protein
MHRNSELTGLPTGWFLDRNPLSRRKYRCWVGRYGKADEQNALVPRDHWIDAAERQRIIDFAQAYPLKGYGRLTFMMLERELAGSPAHRPPLFPSPASAVSRSTTCRVLKEGGLLRPSNQKPSCKGQGFTQPLQPREHWRIAFSYVNIGGALYYRCSVLDGCPSARA